MEHTTLQSLNPTLPLDGNQHLDPPEQLVARYRQLLASRRIAWTAHQQITRLLGRGGQGEVFLSERRGADGFTVPIALKIFSPEKYEDVRSYDLSMARMARVAAHIAQIHHHNLIDVQDFYDRHHIRIMAMEWIDGYDLRHLLSNDRLRKLQDRISGRLWREIKDVVVAPGVVQPRMMPGPAVAILRDCLAALAALHRDGIVHSDVKPGNIMLKLNGSAKIIDIGSAFEISDAPPSRACTPTYAAPEVLDGCQPTPSSDLVSLGYVFLELLAGRPIFPVPATLRELVAAKRRIHQELHQLLPPDVTCNQLLMGFCARLIAPDPAIRFPSAEAAELAKEGAAAFHRQLVIGDLATEYPHELRKWLEGMRELDEWERGEP